jgi:thiamine phosphate synthase YjbQ (UPF0047 family)
MNIIDQEINLELKEIFTPIKDKLEEIIKNENLLEANIVCWVPHEVSSLVQLGWEDGLVNDMKDFLNDTVPEDRWKKHDEEGTPFRYNFFEHCRTKLIGSVSMTFIIKEGKLYLGKYQNIYFYSPVYKNIPNQKIFCRIIRF